MEDILNQIVEAIYWFIDLIKDLVRSVSGKADAATEKADESSDD